MRREVLGPGNCPSMGTAREQGGWGRFLGMLFILYVIYNVNDDAC